MADINKVDLNLGHKIANPFKTTRKSDTNPFRYSNFEGNTLQYADVFEGFDSKEINFKGGKHKLITSSVIGSITKLRNSITESITNFVNRVKDGITGAWDYAKNTEIKLGGLDKISEGLHNTTGKIHDILNYDVTKGLTDSITGLGKHISDSISFLNKDVTEIGHDLSTSWTSLIDKISINKTGHEKISSDMPVATLRELWIKENELLAGQTSAKEIAIDSAHKMEAKVA